MKQNRLLRSLLCLLLVCALIVNISPIRAEAFALEAAAIAGIGALAVMILAYAGVLHVPDSQEAFVAYGNSLINYLKEWGEKNDQSDLIVWWLGQVDVDLTGGGPKRPPIHLPNIIVLALAEWIHDLVTGDAVIESGVETAPDGYAYYNGYLLPSLSGLKYITDDNLQFIYRDSATSEIKLCTCSSWRAFYNDSVIVADYITSSYQYIYYYSLISGAWVYENYVSSLSDIYTGVSLDDVLWASYYIYGRNGNNADRSVVLYEGSEPTSTYSGELKYNALLGDVAPGIEVGTHTADDIKIPNYIDTSQIFQYGDDPSDSVIDAMDDLASGELSYGDYQDMFPMAARPDIYIDLEPGPVTYEQGAATRPLIVNAGVLDGGYLSYQWYLVNGDDFLDTVIEGATGPKFIPKSDTLGSFQYYCHITNILDSGAMADAYTKTTTIEIVAPGTVTNPDVTTDPVTGTGLKEMLTNLGSNISTWFSDLVENVKGIPQAILNGLIGLFVPSTDALAVQQNKWAQLLADRFGIMYEAGDMILDIGDEFSGITVKDTITLPLIEIPLGGGVNWTVGGWTVDVVPDGFEFLIDSLKMIINVLCTFAFIGAMRRRFDRVLEGS